MKGWSLSPFCLGSRTSVTICALSVDILAHANFSWEGEKWICLFAFFSTLLHLSVGPTYCIILSLCPTASALTFLSLHCGLANKQGHIWALITVATASTACIFWAEDTSPVSPTLLWLSLDRPSGTLSSISSSGWFSSFFYLNQLWHLAESCFPPGPGQPQMLPACFRVIVFWVHMRPFHLLCTDTGWRMQGQGGAGKSSSSTP